MTGRADAPPRPCRVPPPRVAFGNTSPHRRGKIGGPLSSVSGLAANGWVADSLLSGGMQWFAVYLS